MTDRYHPGEDIDIPGLKDVLNDADHVESEEEANELLEGLLGSDVADRPDIPSADEIGDQDDDQDNDQEPTDTLTGRWACRFCHTERQRPEHEPIHHSACSDSQFHYEKIQQQQESTETALDDTAEAVETPHPDAGGDSPGEQRTFLVDTQWHEFRAYLKFERHGLDPYYALHSLMRQTNWHDGPPSREIEYDGRKYLVVFTFQESGLEPWSDEDFKIEKVREYRLHLETADGIRKADFLIRPRWPEMESKGDYPAPSNPRCFVGVDVDAQGANHLPGAYPELLDEAMQAFGVNGGSPHPRKRYLSPPNVEPWSIVIDGEQYVRIHEDYSGRLIGINGPLERMNMVLAAERSGYRKRVADDQKTTGYYHTTAFGSMRARKILDGADLGKEVKHYHVKNRDALDEDDPLRHPKFGVSYQRSRSDTRVYWNAKKLADDPLADQDAVGLDHMDRELDEQLLNCLRWAGLPVRPDRQVFVDDAVFKVEPRRRERRLIPDPLPALEEEQEHMVTRALNKMVDVERSTTDAEMIDELLADGGETSPKGLADELGIHYETVLRSLERLGDVVEHSYGDIKLKSHHVAQKLAKRAGALLEDFGRIQDHADRLGSQLLRAVDGLDTERSPFQMWAEKYLESIEDPNDSIRVYLRMGYHPEDLNEAREIVNEGITALRQTLGGKQATSTKIFRNGFVTLNLKDGSNATLWFNPG